jgi:glycosyltransferase involved in cell wall biosynthesis
VRIALVSEGTYPYAMGGVSVWCDQLIRGMPEHRWEMVPLCVDGTERSVFDRPANLDGVHPVALWRPYRQKRVCRPGGDFRVAYREFAYAMLAPLQPGAQRAGAVGARFLRALRRLHDYAAAGGDLRCALVSHDALQLLVDAWYDQRRDDDLRLADAVTASSLIGHMLQPLVLPPIRVDVVHAAMNGLSVLPGLVAKWRRTTPLVLSEHGIYLRERYLGYLSEAVSQPVKVVLLGFFRALAGAGYAAADVIAPHSRYNRRWQLHNGADPGRLWTMYNGVEVDDFPVASTEPTQPTIVFMGRIDPLKDVHTLIRAFALVRAEIPAARLRIFGGTPRENLRYRDSCAELIDELNLGGAAILEGRVDDPADAYHQAHVVALTSISEGFPYTVVEAMACGRPVVCTNVGGVSEAVGEAGFVVPARDAPAIARALVTLLSDHDLRARLGAAARARVLAHFTLAQSLGEYRRVYDSLAGAAAVVAGPPAVAVPA